MQDYISEIILEDLLKPAVKCRSEEGSRNGTQKCNSIYTKKVKHFTTNGIKRAFFLCSYDRAS